MPFGVAELESAQGNYSLMPDLMDSELIKVYFQETQINYVVFC